MKSKLVSPFYFGVLSFLLAQLIIFPVQASHKSWIVVPVLPNDISVKDQEPLCAALKSELQTKYKVKLGDEQAVLDYFNKEAQGEAIISEGDVHFINAKQSYLQFDNNSAEKSLQIALNEYSRNPGTQGGLYQAYLLQALIEDEKGQNAKAKKSMENAIVQKLNQEELMDTFFSPRFRQMYNKVKEGFLKNNEVTSIQIHVVGSNQEQEIYANGVNVGRGPEIQILAMPEQILFLQAGSLGKLYQTKPRSSQNNFIKIRSHLSKNNNSTGLSYGFASQTPNLINEAQWLGQGVSVSNVVLLQAQKIKGGVDVGVSVVDSQTGKATEPKHFKLENYKIDATQASVMISQYVFGLDKSDFVNEAQDSVPIVVEQNKSSKGVLWAVIGGVALTGLGAAAFLGSGSSSNSNSGISVELPPDSVAE